MNTLKAPVKDKKFWQSKNFWTNVGSIILIILASFGIDLPEDTPGQVIDAISTQNWLLLLTTAWNIINIIIHLAKQKKSSRTVKEIVAEAVKEFPR